MCLVVPEMGDAGGGKAQVGDIGRHPSRVPLAHPDQDTLGPELLRVPHGPQARTDLHRTLRSR